VCRIKKLKKWPRANKRIVEPYVDKIDLYGCETWFLMLREEHRPKTSENGVLRGIFLPKKNEVEPG
jgi:hypothetical protein